MHRSNIAMLLLAGVCLTASPAAAFDRHGSPHNGFDRWQRDYQADLAARSPARSRASHAGGKKAEFASHLRKGTPQSNKH